MMSIADRVNVRETPTSRPVRPAMDRFDIDLNLALVWYSA
jgi:hypothetical protein